MESANQAIVFNLNLAHKFKSDPELSAHYEDVIHTMCNEDICPNEELDVNMEGEY